MCVLVCFVMFIQLYLPTPPSPQWFYWPPAWIFIRILSGLGAAVSIWMKDKLSWYGLSWKWQFDGDGWVEKNWSSDNEGNWKIKRESYWRTKYTSGKSNLDSWHIVLHDYFLFLDLGMCTCLYCYALNVIFYCSKMDFFWFRPSTWLEVQFSSILSFTHFCFWNLQPLGISGDLPWDEHGYFLKPYSPNLVLVLS